MSNAIGVGAITLTSDNWIILMKRADWTGEYPGMVDRPGGHPEPDLVRQVIFTSKHYFLRKVLK